jgi:hypothetical protein
MIKCKKCNKLKLDTEFYSKRKSTQSCCKVCFNDYTKKRWNRRKALFINEKGGKCFDCGRTGHPAIFDFHHVDPKNKKFNIRKIRTHNMEKLRQELDKCVVLCACCHRLRHIVSGSWDFDWASPDFKKSKYRQCEKCGKDIRISQKYCSSQCSSQSKEKIAWPSNLSELVRLSSKLAVAKMLGVSDKAVSKRLKNHKV